MAPTASQASSKPPVYPKNGEPAHRAPSNTRSRDPVKKSATDSGLRKRSQSEEVSTRARSQSRSAKSVSSTSTSSSSVIAKSSVDSRDRYIRAAQREGRSQDVRSQPASGKSATRGKASGPLKAFPPGSITNVPSGTHSTSTANLLADLNGDNSPVENSPPVNGRRNSTADRLNKSGHHRPLPVFTKPDISDISPSSAQTLKSVGNGSASKHSGRSQKDSTATSSRSELENQKIDNEGRRTSSRTSIKANQDVTETFERISLDSRSTKSRTSPKSELPDIETIGHSITNTDANGGKGPYPKYAEKSTRLGVNGGGEVLGGRSPDGALQTEGYDYSRVKTRVRRPSIGALKDSANPGGASSRQNKSDFRTETFVFNVDRSLENETEAEERNRKIDSDSTGKLSSSTGTGKPGKGGVVGLQNLGNTCFMNSVLQCLSNTRLLRDYCLDNRYEKDVNRSSSSLKGKMINVYADLMTAMWRGTQSSVSPTEFKAEISNFAKQFVGYREQDAHEFLVYLLEALHEDVNRVREKRRRIIDSTDEVETISSGEKAKISWKNYLACDNSQINDIFVGQLKSTLRCPDCSYVSNTFEPFLALSLPLKKVKTRMSLLDCFKLFSQEEVLDYENQPRCVKCRMQKSCTKQMSIHRFPKVLIIHLMRFKQGSSTKLTTEVTCPLEGLDLSEFASEESIPANESSTAAAVYNLYAVSNHSGSLYSGHYTAYAKNPDSERWHLFNDRNCTSVSLPKLESGQPYLLFYERQEHST